MPGRQQNSTGESTPHKDVCAPRNGGVMCVLACATLTHKYRTRTRLDYQSIVEQRTTTNMLQRLTSQPGSFRMLAMYDSWMRGWSVARVFVGQAWLCVLMACRSASTHGLLRNKTRLCSVFCHALETHGFRRTLCFRFVRGRTETQRCQHAVGGAPTQSRSRCVAKCEIPFTQSVLPGAVLAITV